MGNTTLEQEKANETKTFEISIGRVWVDDGFELTEESIKNAILDHCLPFACDYEVKVSEVE